MKVTYSILCSILLISGMAVSGFAQSKFEKKGDKMKNNFSYQAATEFYLKAAEEDKGNGNLKLKLAECYQKLNDPENTVKWYREIIQNEDLVKPEDKYNYAYALLSTGNSIEAERWFDAYAAEEPEDERSARFLKQLENVKELYQDSSLHEIELAPFNSVASDFSPSFYKNGIVFVSGRTPGRETYKWNESSFLDLYYAGNKSLGMFEQPVPFHQKINTNYHEGPVSFYAGGRKMALTRNNLEKGKLGKSSTGVTKLKLYFTTPDAKEGWADVEAFAYNSDEYSVGHPAVAEDGSVMYFISDMPGGFGGTDIYITYFENGLWSKPENLGDQVNTEGNEMFPFLSRDESLFFASNGRGGLGGLDIFKYTFDNKEIRNLGYPINSIKDDFGYIVNEDGEGFLSSNRQSSSGADDIFQFSSIKTLDAQVKILVVREENNAPIAGATVTIKEVNSDFTWVKQTGDDGYLTIPLHIYRQYDLTTTKNGFDQNNQKLDLGGDAKKLLVKLKGTCLMVKGIASLSEKEDANQSVLVVLSDDQGVARDSTRIKNGDPFTFCTKPQSNYQLKASSKDYFAKSVELYIGDQGPVLLKEIVLEKIVIDKAIKVENIYYDLGKWDIRPDAARELDKLAALLDDNPTIEIELSSHTDSRGGDAFNLNLSDKRANSAAEYIVSQGIAAHRVKSKGYGEISLINRCANGVNCSAEEHQANRRTEFKVLKY